LLLLLLLLTHELFPTRARRVAGLVHVLRSRSFGRAISHRGFSIICACLKCDGWRTLKCRIRNSAGGL
jgi:hypothetical protein